MTARLAALALAILAAGCSVTKEPGAYGAIAADTLSTKAALAAGGVEVNPLGWATLPLSIGLVEHAKTLPPEERVPLVHSVSAVKWGAAAANLAGMAFGPAGLFVGIAIGGLIWDHGAPEREYWAICAQWRADNPAHRCLPFGVPYDAPQQASATAR